MAKPSVVIVSPALADANNGNWQTARRWQRMLAPTFTARIVRQWPDGDAAAADVAMLALHARRSAASVEAWAQTHADRSNEGSPATRLAVILTGTDLYRDIQSDAAAQRSLALATQLVVLQAHGLLDLPAPHRPKTRVIFQSTGARQPAAKPASVLRAVMVGHLRDEKSPETLFEAARLLAQHPDIRIDHIGDPLDPALGEQARATAAQCPGYRWLGGLPHGATRARIQRAHLLVHTSRMEGGAHVIMEAVRSGTPVLASRVPGNIGMLGDGYAGYFPHGDAAALAALLLRCRAGLADPAGPGNPPDDLFSILDAQCRERAPLFAPETERAALMQLVRDLLPEKP